MTRDADPETCFHCGLPADPRAGFSATVDGVARPMCCAGCAAVAEAIDRAGLAGYYRHRTANPRSAQNLVPIELEQLAVYDNDEIQKSFVQMREGSERRANLVLEGIECAACIWLNERHLKKLPGVVEVSINYSTQQASIAWDNDRVRLSDILAAIQAIGYDAHPYDPNRQQLVLDAQRKKLLKQLGAAAAIGMQVMILTVALYAGEWYGMEPEFEQFFRKFSLLLTIPVLFYSGSSFFRNAWTDLKLRRVSMDVPVSIGIGLAFGASTLHVVTGDGAIYFESVCMFVLFLLAARYFELMSRTRAMLAAESIGYLKPSTARRLADGVVHTVPAVELEPGDLIRVLPGDTIPVDGVVESGRSGVDESIVTGESAPVVRGHGDPVIGGSVNTDSPLEVRVTRTGDDTVLAEIHRLLGKAFSEKPKVAQLADRVAAYFVAGVLTVTSLVGLFWYLRGSPGWLEITVAVLVVSCPCALSLAVPTALSSSIARLMRGKILVTSERALETLPNVDRFVFDKTGTLTEGRPRVTSVEAFGHPKDDCLTIAAALESASEHPLAHAIRDAAATCESVPVSDPENRPGAGVLGTVNGERYWIGNRAFIAQSTRAAIPEPGTERQTEIFLADDASVLCRFAIRDEVRDDSLRTISDLNERGVRTVLLSGDNRQVAEEIGRNLGIDEIIGECTPAQKLARVKEWQAAGDVVAMVGDGVNDAPVLAGADVSISVGGASAIAVASADIVLLSSNIYSVVEVYDTSRRTLGIMKQNLLWAIGYNVLAIPAAAAGLVAPWLAALGMSLSSLVVIGNANRLRKDRRPSTRSSYREAAGRPRASNISEQPGRP